MKTCTRQAIGVAECTLPGSRDNPGTKRILDVGSWKWRMFPLLHRQKIKKSVLQAMHEVTNSGINEGGSMAWISDFLVKDIEASMEALRIMRNTVL
jgi:hypothetical protein